jgi:hypothetical protein
MGAVVSCSWVREAGVATVEQVRETRQRMSEDGVPDPRSDGDYTLGYATMGLEKEPQ